ncbi:MAG: hypothetical protein J0H21_03625, partial [Rhizobiales bacterium]|nr:hypothetical protein [Hyphomicrobiales bacterium]
SLPKQTIEPDRSGRTIPPWSSSRGSPQHRRLSFPVDFATDTPQMPAPGATSAADSGVALAYRRHTNRPDDRAVVITHATRLGERKSRATLAQATRPIQLGAPRTPRFRF